MRLDSERTDSARWKPCKHVPAIVILSFLAYELVNAALVVVFACSSPILPPPPLFSAHSNLASSPEALLLTSLLLDLMDIFQMAAHLVSLASSSWYVLCLAVPFGFLSSSFIQKHSDGKSLLSTGLVLRSTWETIKVQHTDGMLWGLFQGGWTMEKGSHWVSGAITSTWLPAGKLQSLHSACILYLLPASHTSPSTMAGTLGNEEPSRPLNFLTSFSQVYCPKDKKTSSAHHCRLRLLHNLYLLVSFRE